MFEDDVTVPAGWYPDPMGLPQLRWWNNHAWTELTTEAHPPLVVHTSTRLAFADDEVPTRRQQREQRERDEEYATLATDEDEAKDAAAAHTPLSVTLREIDAPATLDEDRAADEPHGDEIDDIDDIDDDAVDPGDRDPDPVSPPAAATPAAATPAAAKRPADPSVVNLDTIDYDTVASDAGDSDAYMPRPAFIPTQGSVLGSAAVAGPTLPQPAGGDGSFDSTGSFESIPRGRSLLRLPIYTAPVWIIALVPLLLLVLSLLLLLGFGSSLNMWVTPAMWAISYIVVVILAIADRAALGRAGYEHRASWAWALLTAPIYLLARSMSLAKVGPLGFAPVLVWTALGILQIGSVLVVPGLIISALPHVFTTQAEQSIASDASIIGANITVDCAKNLPVIVGQTFTCVATSANKDPFTVTASLQRTNGWINWHVEDWGVYTLSR